MKQASILHGITLSIALVCGGCSQEAVDLTPVDTPTPQDAMQTTLENDSTSQDFGLMDAQAPVTTYPDEAVFAETVLPILERGCGAGCHLGDVDLDNNEQGPGNHFEFDPEDVVSSIEEMLHPAYANLRQPAESEVLLHHNGDYFATLDQKRAVRDWIADASVPKETEMVPDAVSGLTCEHLPSGDGIGPNGWYDAFAQTINPMFVGTLEEPEGYCSGAGCHTDVGVGGALNLLPIDDSCSARWNFYVSQAFINIQELSASPLLRKPLGEATADPNVNVHGGREVFKGQDDNYILLKRWITMLSEDG